MIMGICLRIVGDYHIAEDAFQATFLLFAQKAADLKKRESLSAWLHGVAVRVAREAVRRRAQLQQLQQTVAIMLEGRAQQAVTVDQVREALDEELDQIPPKYKLPVILCFLEGLTQKEAGERLGLREDALRKRMAAGLRLLKERIGKRLGLSSIALLGMALSQPLSAAALPPELLAKTTAAAAMIAGGQLAAANALTSAPAMFLAKTVTQSFVAKSILKNLGLLAVAASLTGGTFLGTNAILKVLNDMIYPKMAPAVASLEKKKPLPPQALAVTGPTASLTVLSVAEAPGTVLAIDLKIRNETGRTLVLQALRNQHPKTPATPEGWHWLLTDQDRKEAYRIAEARVLAINGKANSQDFEYVLEAGTQMQFSIRLEQFCQEKSPVPDGYVLERVLTQEASAAAKKNLEPGHYRLRLALDFAAQTDTSGSTLKPLVLEGEVELLPTQ